VAVVGTTTPGNAAQQIVTGTGLVTGTTTLAVGLLPPAQQA